MSSAVTPPQTDPPDLRPSASNSTRVEPFTPSGLREKARPLHQQGLRLMNPGWLCAGAALGLSVLGVVAISGTTEPDMALRHLAFLCLGVVAAGVMTIPHYRLLDVLAWPALLFVLALLVFVLIPQVPEWIVRPRNNARRWISLIIFDFQPSELAKIAYVLVLASYLKHRRSYRTFRGLMLPLALTFLPMALIIVEPDLGTSMLFLPTCFAMLIAAGAKIRHLLLIVIIGLAAAPTLYPALQPHQQDRIKAMVAQMTGDERYDRDIGYQGAKARMLVGAGGIAGAGAEHARDLIRFNELPEEHNDMIFAVVCCRWGLLGALATGALFLCFTIGALLAAAQTRDPFGKLVPVGLVAVLLAQFVINTGMTIGLLPITGMTLPFVSYGGSSLIASWLMVGLVMNIAMRRDHYLVRDAFEFGEDEDE